LTQAPQAEQTIQQVSQQAPVKVTGGKYVIVVQAAQRMKKKEFVYLTIILLQVAEISCLPGWLESKMAD